MITVIDAIDKNITQYKNFIFSRVNTLESYRFLIHRIRLCGFK